MKTITQINDQSSDKDLLAAIREALELPANASPLRVIQYLDRAAGFPHAVRNSPDLHAAYLKARAAGHTPKDAMFLANREVSAAAVQV